MTSGDVGVESRRTVVGGAGVEVRRGGDIALMGGVGADRGDRDQLRELRQEPIERRRHGGSVVSAEVVHVTWRHHE